MSRLEAQTITVDTNAPTAVTPPGVPWSGVIKVNGAATVNVGPSSITTTTGFPIAAGETLPVDLDADDGPLYAIATTGSQELLLLGVVG